MYFPLYYKNTILLMYSFMTAISAIPIIKSPYDSHNCCISCGYEYCESLMECVRPWEIECPKVINPFIITEKNIDDRY